MASGEENLPVPRMSRERKRRPETIIANEDYCERTSAATDEGDHLDLVALFAGGVPAQFARFCRVRVPGLSVLPGAGDGAVLQHRGVGGGDRRNGCGASGERNAGHHVPDESAPGNSDCFHCDDCIWHVYAVIDGYQKEKSPCR